MQPSEPVVPPDPPARWRYVVAVASGLAFGAALGVLAAWVI